MLKNLALDSRPLSIVADKVLEKKQLIGNLCFQKFGYARFARSKKLVIEFFLLSLILLTSLVFRWVNLYAHPHGLEGDEIYWAVTSYLNGVGLSPSSVGVWSLIERISFFYPVSPALNRLSFFLFGHSIYSPRKILFILFLISSVFFYLFLRKVISKKSALLLIAIFNFSTFPLFVSRVPLQQMYCAFLAIITLYFYHLFTELPSEVSATRFALLGLLSSIFLQLTIHTYHLGYLLIVYFSMNLILRRWLFHRGGNKSSAGNKKMILSLAVLLLPFLLLASSIVKTVTYELDSRQYALGNSPVAREGGNKTSRSFFEFFYIIPTNFQRSLRSLFVGISFEESDMIFPSGKPFFNPILSLVFFIGLFSLIKDRKRNLLFWLWLLIGVVGYQVLFGLNLPRFWVVNIYLFYIVIGLGLDNIFALFSKYGTAAKLGLNLLVFSFVLVSISHDTQYYLSKIVDHYSFRQDFKEVHAVVNNKLPHEEHLRITIITEYPELFHMLYVFYLHKERPDLPVVNLYDRSWWRIVDVKDQPREKQSSMILGYLEVNEGESIAKTLVIDNKLISQDPALLSRFSGKEVVSQHEHFTEYGF